MGGYFPVLRKGIATGSRGWRCVGIICGDLLGEMHGITWGGLHFHAIIFEYIIILFSIRMYSFMEITLDNLFIASARLIITLSVPSLGSKYK